jgi:hypothetical protein
LGGTYAAGLLLRGYLLGLAGGLVKSMYALLGGLARFIAVGIEEPGTLIRGGLLLRGGLTITHNYAQNFLAITTSNGG